MELSLLLLQLWASILIWPELSVVICAIVGEVCPAIVLGGRGGAGAVENLRRDGNSCRLVEGPVTGRCPR